MKTTTFLTGLALVGLAFFVSCKKDKNDFVNDPGGYSNTRSVGESSADLLRSTQYTSLKIEIIYMPGYAPDAGAISHLHDFLAATLHKPGGITITSRQIAASGSATLTLAQIKDLESNNRTTFTSGTELGVNILLTDGAYSDAGVLGIAYRNTSLVLLGGTIQSNSGGIGQASRTKLEATVIEHEFSHILGLVDIGSPMQTAHKDAEHGNHCSNTACLMYYSAETTDVLGFLVTGAIPTLDAACRQDLVANGGQ